jgi:NADH:ubiquinone oxidoreductase subunit F (NADH-binding)
VRAPGRPVSLEEHDALHGSLPPAADLLAKVEASGLRGRGGAGFPTALKLRAVVARHRRPVVVANGAEGEPVSAKDRALLHLVPHLVLDGVVLAAEAVGARRAILAVCERRAGDIRLLGDAIETRRRRGDNRRVDVRLAVVPSGFVVGEETALVQFLDGGPAKPTFVPPRPFERGLGGAPTLVQNVETLAHVALIARYGPEWFRGVGTPDDPGSALVTLSGAVARPGVVELALGTPLPEAVGAAGGLIEPVTAFLIGGYFGTWVDARVAARLTLDDVSLGLVGTALGARAIVALPEGSCGLAETARVARYLAAESAGQCGPCVRGLDAIAAAVERLLRPDSARARDRLSRWLGQVEGRGACRHPDGAARFVASALDTFAADIASHSSGRGCGARTAPFLPVGRPVRERR